MKLKNAKIRMLDLDLKGCIYLNTFSRSERVAQFFKIISRLGDGMFWYVMLAAVWILQGLMYGLQMLYLMLGGSVGTSIYKLLKKKTVRPRPYQVHQVIRLGERPLDHFSFPSGHTLHAVMTTTVLGYVQPILLVLIFAFHGTGGAVPHGAGAALSKRCRGWCYDWRSGCQRHRSQRAAVQYCAIKNGMNTL